MSAPPARASLFPVGSLAPANAKTYFGQLYDYIIALLGADGTAAAARNALAVPMPNHLHNPDGAVYQRAVAATTDGNYIDDRWYVLTQTASVTPSKASAPENGYRWALRLTQSQVTAQRMGRAQVVPGSVTYALRGKTVTAGGRLRLSTSATVRYALLAWTGTENVVTRDVVNDWTNATITTGNFFNSTTLTLIAAGSTALTAATAASCSVSGQVPSGATNLVFVYWTDATAAQNVTLDAWGMRLVEATSLVDAIARDIAQEEDLCRRWCRAFAGGVAGFANGTTVAEVGISFDPPMEAAPTLTATAILQSINHAGGSSVNPSSAAVASLFASRYGASFRFNNYTGLTSGQGLVLQGLANPTAIFSCDL